VRRKERPSRGRPYPITRVGPKDWLELELGGDGKAGGGLEIGDSRFKHQRVTTPEKFTWEPEETSSKKKSMRCFFVCAKGIQRPLAKEQNCGPGAVPLWSILKIHQVS